MPDDVDPGIPSDAPITSATDDAPMIPGDTYIDLGAAMLAPSYS